MPGTWTTVSIAGHPCGVYEPPKRNPHGFVLVYLHGVRLTRLDQNTAFTCAFARHGLPVVAPITGRSWWTNKICPEFDPQVSAERHLLDHVLPYLADEYAATPPGIALLGTSMGGQGAIRFALKHPRTFPVAAGIAPAIDYQLRFSEPGEQTLPQMYPDAESVRQDTATLHVHPLNWPRNLWFCSDPADLRWHESAQKLRMKLAALGIPHTCDLETSAGGHTWDYYNHQATAAVEWVAQSLERERLRMV